MVISMSKKKLVFGILLPLVILIICLMSYAGVSLSDVWQAAVDGTQKMASKEAWKESAQESVSGFSGEKIPVTSSNVQEPENPPAFEEYDITLMALGDNLLHPGIIKTGIQSDGSYDFSFLFQNISDFLAKADIKVINQETIFGGNELGTQGYPKFNSPTQVGDAIVAAGFNIVLHATNHAADQGIEGILHCASYWEQHPEVLMTGISEEETYSEIPLLQVGDINFAILNYTYGPNLGSVPESLRGHLNILCDYNRQTGALDFTKLNPDVLEDIKKAKTMADVVIVFPHWGTEYQSTPSNYQRKFAKEMTEAGADLLIGTHPHVPQPVEWIEAENGNRALCYYSLGNYVSLQKQAASMLEGMAWVTFHVSEEGVTIAEDKTGVLPMVCQYKQASFRLENVYFLEEYTEEMAKRHGIQSYEEGVVIKLEELKEQSQNTFGDMVLTREDILASE